MDRKRGSRKPACIFNFSAGNHGKQALQQFVKQKRCWYEYTDYYKCKHSVRDSSLACLAAEKELINDEVMLMAISILTDQFYEAEGAYCWNGIFVIKDPLFAHQLFAITPCPWKKSFEIGKFQLSYENLALQIGQYFGSESCWDRRGWKLGQVFEEFGIKEFLLPCCIPYKHWFMIRINLEKKITVCSSSDYQTILFAGEELPEDFPSFEYSFDQDFLLYMKGKRKTVKELNNFCQKFNLFSKHSKVRHSLIALFMPYCMNEAASFLFHQLDIVDKKSRLEWKFTYDHTACQIDGSLRDGGLFCLDMFDTTLRKYKGDKKYFTKMKKYGRANLLNFITNPNFVTRKELALEEDKDDDDEVQIVEENASVEVIATIALPSRANPNRKAKLLSQQTPLDLPDPNLTETLNTAKMGAVGAKLMKSIFLDYKADDDTKKIFRNYLREFGAYVLTNAPIESTPDEELKIIAYILIEHNHLREFPETENEASEEIPETKIEPSQICAIVHLHSHTTNHDYLKSVFGKGPRNSVREKREKGLFEDSIPLRYLMSQVALMIMSKNKRDGTKMKALYFPVYKITTGEHLHDT